jgi:hypothetical protein
MSRQHIALRQAAALVALALLTLPAFGQSTVNRGAAGVEGVGVQNADAPQGSGVADGSAAPATNTADDRKQGTSRSSAAAARNSGNTTSSGIGAGTLSGSASAAGAGPLSTPADVSGTGTSSIR